MRTAAPEAPLGAAVARASSGANGPAAADGGVADGPPRKRWAPTDPTVAWFDNASDGLSAHG